MISSATYARRRVWDISRFATRAITLTFVLNALLHSSAAAQGNVGIGTTTPDASALLDLTSTTQGFLAPRTTNTQMLGITSPATGLMVFNTTAGSYYYYTGSTWAPFMSASSGWLTSGNSGTNVSNDYLGTSDNQALAIRTNNVERLRILSSGEIGIGVTTPLHKLQLQNGNLALTNNTNTAAELRFYEPTNNGGANYTAFKATTQSDDITYTLPATAPTAGQVLTAGATPTDLTWTTVSSSSLWVVGGGTGSLVGVGSGNSAAGAYAIAAGQNNSAAGTNATAIGGSTNTASGNYSTVAGGQQNVANTTNATVGGGYLNLASGTYATIAGGQNSTASGTNAFIGGGNSNTASGLFSTIGGGQSNQATNQYAGVAAGQSNTATNAYAYVGGGLSNSAQAQYSTVGGGNSNTVSGNYSTIAGGRNNSATATYNFVAGYNNSTGSNAHYSMVFGAGASVSNANTIAFHHVGTGGSTLVGIRKTDPTEALDVTGNIRLSGALMPNNTAGTSGQVLRSGGAGAAPTWADLGSISWSLTGNSGTSASTNFLGTTDAVDLVVRTNNTERMRVESGGDVGIGTNNPAHKLEVAGGTIAVTNSNNTASTLRFYEPSSSGSNYTELKARTQTSNISYNWPDTAGQANDVLTTDANGNLYWSNNLLTGSLYLGGTTSATISSNAHNFALDANYTIHRISAQGNQDITGFAGGADGRVIIVINVGNSTITLKWQDNNSDAANRIIGSGGNLQLGGDQSASLVYDGVAQRWRVYATYP
jgi:hypothetical protein